MSPATKTTPATSAVTALSDPAAEAAIHAACRALALPTIRAEAIAMAEASAKQRLTHKAFLAELLTAECDERDARRRIRRVNEAKFPRTKRLTDFDPNAVPDLPPRRWPTSPPVAGSTRANRSCCSVTPAQARPTCSSRWAPAPPNRDAGSAT